MLLTCSSELRCSLFQSDPFEAEIDYEDMLSMNATFEMTEKDISLVSKFLKINLTTLVKCVKCVTVLCYTQRVRSDVSLRLKPIKFFL